jgi:hypothetical protein
MTSLNGQVDPDALRKAATAVPGLDVASMRTSTEPATVSFALNERASSIQAAVDGISKALGGKASIILLKSVAPTTVTAQLP